MNAELCWASIAELSRGLGEGAFGSADLAGCFVERIRRLDPRLNAYVRFVEDEVMAQAEASDRRRASGYSLGPLDGVPIAVKDLFEIEGQVATIGSAAFEGRKSTTTSTVVRRLLGAGAVILGKTQMVEFAFGGWGTNPLLGTPVNPWDETTARIPGGSSSGSGVAVAAGLAPAAIGSDTGGSIRIPASLNGLTGLKTTYGLIDLHGAFPLSQTLDSAGPMTRDATDAALLAQTLSEAMPATGIGPRRLPDWAAALRAGADLRGIRIAILPPEQFPIAASAAVLHCYADFQRQLRDLGALIEEARFPFDFGDLMRRNGALIASEAFAVHRAYIEDAQQAFGPWVRGRIQAGRSVSAADYIELLADHRRRVAAWTEWMEPWDALLTPTLPIAACPITEVDETATPLAAFTRAGNYLGACGLSLPAGFDKGLPVGMQLLGKPFDDALLIRIGRAVQSVSDLHRRRPAWLE